jgi:hypothetical protein
MAAFCTRFLLRRLSAIAGYEMLKLLDFSGKFEMESEATDVA